MSNGISDVFCCAARDYLYLLERRFPQKAILKLVGDRYSLSGVERTMLYRWIINREVCRGRGLKKLMRLPASGTALHVDAYNVLLTVGSYLNGSKVFIAMDGFLRDASEVHGKVFRRELFSRSLSLIFDFLEKRKALSIFFYLDRPVSHSGELAAQLNTMMGVVGITGGSSVHDSADYVLKRLEHGYCATSDSAIIDHTQVRVYDLAREVLKKHFHPDFTDLRVIPDPDVPWC